MNSNQAVQHSPVAESAPTTIGLHASQVSLAFGENSVLQDINFTLPATGVVTLIGPSGAGKSSLLRCINLLNREWRGEITLFNHDVRRWSEGEDALRRTVGLIAQKPALFPCSIAQNVLFGLTRQARRACSLQQLEQVLRQAALWDEVSHRLHAPAHTLSVGQQQRLCIARALALSPAMLLLDEPTASLDPNSKQFIEASLLALAQTMPLLCVTHDIEQAKRLGGGVIFMCDGRIIEQGAAEPFFNRPQRIESREFLRWSVCDCN